MEETIKMFEAIFTVSAFLYPSPTKTWDRPALYCLGLMPSCRDTIRSTLAGSSQSHVLRLYEQGPTTYIIHGRGWANADCGAEAWGIVLRVREYGKCLKSGNS